MKSLKYLIVTLFVITCIDPCYAQYDDYYKVDQDVYVTTNPNAQLREITSSQYNALSRSRQRNYIDLSNLKAKKIRKPNQFKVLRYTNTSKQSAFDAYVVEYKDRLWVLCNFDVQDNTLMNSRSSNMLQARDALESKIEALDREYTRIKGQSDSLLSVYIEECSDSLDYYNNLRTRLPIIRDSLVAVAELQESRRVEKIYNEWYDKQSASAKKAAKALSIDIAELDYPNVVGGCDYTFYYTNRSPKTIKYLYWTGTAYNAVDDPVYCDIRRTSSYKGQDVGPVETGEQGGGVWDCVVYNHSADTLKLSNISITYMDGSTLSIAAADIRQLFNAPSTEVYVSRSDVTKSIMSDAECSNTVNKWSRRLQRLQDKDFSKTYYYSDHEFDAMRFKFIDFEDQLKDIKREKEGVQNQLNTFDKFVGFETYKDSTPSSYYGSSYSSSSATNNKKSKKIPFVTAGIEGSIEGLSSMSTGWGVSMRIGKFNSLFNATIGAKYQYTGYSADLWKYKVHQAVLPMSVNINLTRNEYFGFYLGIGYEYGFLINKSETYEGLYSYSYYDGYYDNDDVVTLAVPSRAVVYQLGFGGRHWDWKVYFKLNTKRAEFENGELGSLGTALTYYF